MFSDQGFCLHRVIISVVEHFTELLRVTLMRNQSLYTLPVGETRPYFSFERLARRISEAHVSDNPALRHSSVANKWKTIHLLLHPGHNATQLQYNLTFQRDDATEFVMSFSVAVDTREVPQANVSQAASKDSDQDPKPTSTPEPTVPFADVPEDQRGPRIQKSQPGEPLVVVEAPSLNVSLLPAAVQSELQKLEEKLLIGDITVKGYNLTKAGLLKPYKALAQKQQDIDSPPASEGEEKAKGKPDEDLEGKPPAEEKAENIIQKNPNSKEEIPWKDIPHTDKYEEDTPEHYALNTVIERPMTSKLLGSISKSKKPEDPAEGAPLGRRLLHFISADRGFLPWERRKYFQKLLEVSRTHFSTFLPTVDFILNINLFCYRKRSDCREKCRLRSTAAPHDEGCRTLLPTPCATSTSCSTASLDSRPARSPHTCLT